MLALDSDKTYRLNPVTATGGAGDGKVYFHIKFTDSSFRAIEDYASRSSLQSKKASLGQIFIDFNSSGDGGHFDVPMSGDSKGGSSNVRRFQFSLAPILMESSASFECFLQKKTGENLAAFGAFARRLTVKAQEDVFGATKEKMAAVDEESKRKQAREISTTGSSNTLKGGSLRKSAGHGGGAQSISSRPLPTATSASQLFDAASVAKRKAAERLSSVVPTNVPTSSSSAVKKKSQRQTPQHSLRDRVLYSLAVKPQTESQLTKSLNLSSSDFADVTKVVKQICCPPSSQTGGVLSLRREAFSEIKYDHPLIANYDEKMAIRKNSAQAAQQSSTSSSSSSGGQKPPRPLASDGALQPVAKSRRLESAMTTTSSVPPTTSSLKSRPATTGLAPGKLHGRNKNSPHDILFDPDFIGACSSSSTATRNTDAKDLNDFGEMSRDSASQMLPVISNREQRSAMKNEYMTKYSEYRRLYDSLSTKVAFFRDIRPKLEACEPGSEQYESLDNSIRKAYAKLMEDESYLSAKRKLSELHETLAGIKHAIEEFDTATGTVSSSSTSTTPSSSSPALQRPDSSHSSTALASTSTL